jgi:ABC-type branched-subunit amino acid transport system substrate-binding protein
MTDRNPGHLGKLALIFVAGALVGAISAVEIVPTNGKTQVAGKDLTGPVTDPAGNPQGGALIPGGSSAQPGGPNATVPGGLAPVPGLECNASRNGGATDRGVTGSEIRLATTVVDSGIGAAFLRDVRFAMEAVRNRVNRAGGICGRRLTIRYIDDGWDAQKGSQFIRNLIFEPSAGKQIFAVPVGPSSEGLRVVIQSGDIDRTQTPVVGADGLLADQYVRADGRAQPWVWPVAPATISSARIMATEAHSRGARNFSIVFDKNYRFGVEGAQAFDDEVFRLTKKHVSGFNRQNNCQKAYCGIVAGQSSYSTEVETFEEGDFVALFLEPQTALTWMNDPNTPPAKSIQVTYGYGAAQPLFTRNFAVNCQSKCDLMGVWTGFKPFIESYKNDAAVRAYVEDLKSTNPQADEFNAFAEGGYVGMLMLVEALKQVGPQLTRARLKAVLDVLRLQPGLTIQSTLVWSPANRFAATTMQKFDIQYKGTFGGWRAGPIVADPRPGKTTD